jgi:ABC-type phosphate/phosphonate transport system ATPase subunit
MNLLLGVTKHEGHTTVLKGYSIRMVRNHCWRILLLKAEICPYDYRSFKLDL